MTIHVLHTKFSSRYREICTEKSPPLYLYQTVYCMGQNAASIMMVNYLMSQRQVKIPCTIETANQLAM